ncbi:MAG: hypothetical protein IPP13_21255 [Kouleothrix sp.]|jgi:hypothetical protein|nr:hypothetical protein [Kouleothrix sp.]
MKFSSRLLLAMLAALAVLALAACGGSAPAKLADIPSYPDAVQLKPGENPIADTLAKNVQQAGSMGANIDQTIFTLPQGASWDQVKQFYTDKLGSDGWQSTNLPIPDNDVFKMANWRRGSQNLTVAQLTEPVKNDTFLLFSLATN